MNLRCMLGHKYEILKHRIIYDDDAKCNPQAQPEESAESVRLLRQWGEIQDAARDKLWKILELKDLKK